MDVNNNELQLDDSQDIKTLIIRELMKEGAPKSKEDRMMLLSFLDSRDKVALGRMKLANDKDMGNRELQAAADLADLLRQAGSAEHKPFVSLTPQKRELPQLPNDSPKLVKDEMATTHEELTFESFTTMGRKAA